MGTSKQDIEHRIIELLRHRAKTASICPSEVARSFAVDEDEWRALMLPVREVAARMAQEETVLITQRGVTLNPAHIGHGAIRLRRGPKFPALK